MTEPPSTHSGTERDSRTQCAQCRTANGGNRAPRRIERPVRGEPRKECSTQAGNVQTAAEKTEYFALSDGLQRLAGATKQPERYVGGWSPLTRNTLRILTSAGRFNRSAATVARPDAVMPSMCVALSSHRKCEYQCCRRGWNSVTISPLKGSGAVDLTALWPLHPAQAYARLSSSVAPPAARGMMCSTTKGEFEKRSWLWQYSQRCPDRSRTIARTATGIPRFAATGLLPTWVQFIPKLRQRHAALLRKD